MVVKILHNQSNVILVTPELAAPAVVCDPPPHRNKQEEAASSPQPSLSTSRHGPSSQHHSAEAHYLEDIPLLASILEQARWPRSN